LKIRTLVEIHAPTREACDWMAERLLMAMDQTMEHFTLAVIEQAPLGGWRALGQITTEIPDDRITQEPHAD
jgi:hypothetical protein